MSASTPALQGIIPPIASPIRQDEAIDDPALRRLVEFLIEGGVHGLWVLGTTARFDLLTDDEARRATEIVAEEAAGRVPLVLNISDMGTRRTLARARRFADLPYDVFAALPPWYQPLPERAVLDYFRRLADELDRPLVIYNAPWVCNQLGFEALQKLAEHPRIVGVKDVTPSLERTQNWPADERKALGFSYLHGFDLIGLSTALGADGFVPAIGNAFPELCVAVWDAARAGDDAAAFRLQLQLTRIVRALNLGPTLACLEAACQFRGLLDRMLPHPMGPLDEPTRQRVIQAIDAVGYLPEPSAAAAR